MTNVNLTVGGGVKLPIGPVNVTLGLRGVDPTANNAVGYGGSVSVGNISGSGSYNPITGDWNLNGSLNPSIATTASVGVKGFAGFGIDQNGAYFAAGGQATFNGGSPYLISTANVTYKENLFTWDEVLDAFSQMGIDIVDYFDELFGSPEDPFPASNAITAMAQALAEFFPTPIVLHLDNDNIEYIANTATTGVFFDIDADGFAEKTEWLAPDDGFLVRDLNGNGTIDSQAEMFGDNGGTTAYAKLASLNSNNTGASANAITNANNVYHKSTFLLTNAA